MSSPPLYLNTITIQQASSLDEKFRLAKKSGFQGLEMWTHEVAPLQLSEVDKQQAANRYNVDIDNTDITLEAVGSLVEKYGLPVSGLCPPTSAALRWHDDLDDRVMEAFELAIKSCRALGGKYIILPVLGSGGTLEETAANLKTIGELAEPHKIRLAFEPIGHIGKCSTLAEAMTVLELAGLGDGAGLIVDAFHFFRARQDLSELAHVPVEQIAAVHLNDGMDMPVDQMFGHKHRVYPGLGIWDIAGFCRAIRDMDYQGPFVTEILNEDYWRDDPRDVCGLAQETSLRVIEGNGAP